MTSDDQYIVLASDGVWEHLDNDQVVKIINEHGSSAEQRKLACKAVVDRAYTARLIEDVRADDITIVIIDMDPLSAAEGHQTDRQAQASAAFQAHFGQNITRGEAEVRGRNTGEWGGAKAVVSRRRPTTRRKRVQRRRKSASRVRAV
jgi:hypothetical protein